jgi:hypothetical protein
MALSFLLDLLFEGRASIPLGVLEAFAEKGIHLI